MRMRYLIGVFLLVSLIGCSSSNEVQVSIKIDIQPPPGGFVTLYELSSEGMKPVDTLELVDLKTYEVILPLVQTESFYRIDVFRQQFVNLVFDGSERQVMISLEDGDKEIQGSVKSQQVNQMDELLASGKEQANQFNQQAMQANQQGNQLLVQSIVDQYNEMVRTQIGELKGIIRESNPSLVSMYGLNFLDMESEFNFYDTIVSSTFQKMPDHFWVKELKDNLEEARMLAIGQPAPNFTLDDPNGQPISLSDFKGKYVLIDFWAAWCRPCRMENPNVVLAYQKYGGEQFEILGVSLDKTRESWLKAIEDDGLMWKHASDLQYFNSAAAQLYGINSIPATYLIDPAGNILAKNLRGSSLDAKLEELFGR